MGDMKLGLIVGMQRESRESFDLVRQVEVPTCQIAAVAERVLGHVDPLRVRDEAARAGIEISAVFLLFEGQEFDRITGPPTMGFVPEKMRAARLELAKGFSDMAREMEVPTIVCHVGFIPNDSNDPLYPGFIRVMREVASYCRGNGQRFHFETGQELPSTLLRTIHDIGTDNLGVNLDPANLILYGMAHPLDAAELLGEYVGGMHAKDGLWPNRDEGLGLEVPLGEGKVPFQLLVPKLKEKGFRGPVTIEREITGPEQRADILRAKKILEPLL